MLFPLIQKMNLVLQMYLASKNFSRLQEVSETDSLFKQHKRKATDVEIMDVEMSDTTVESDFGTYVRLPCAPITNPVVVAFAGGQYGRYLHDKHDRVVAEVSIVYIVVMCKW